MALAQLCTLEIDGVSAALRVTGLHGRERIHAPWAFEIVCAAFEQDGSPVEIAPADALTKPASLSWDLGDGTRRTIEGVVDSVDASWRSLRVRVVPKLGLLGDRIDHRIFVDKTAVEIAESVLAEHGLSLDLRVERAVPKRPECVQVFESDLDFVARLFAEEGIAAYLPLGQSDVLVASDHPGGFDDVPELAELRVAEAAGAVAGESVFAARLRRTLVSDKLSLRDYFYENPMLDLSVSAEEESGDRERYEYPGRYSEPGVGDALAKIRLDQLRGKKLVLTAETTCRRLSPGHVVTLSEAQREEMNQRWLVIDVEHTARDQGARGDEDRYRARFSAVPASAGHRPERPDTPELGGVQTATVSGASGAEIHTDKFGRVVVHHRWDRVNPPDEKASAPARVVQPPLSGGFLLPRMGWESLILFSDRCADVPVSFGRLYNGQARPPSGLPGDKVVSAFGTQTTPGGGSANVVKMNDTAGNEGMSFTASKDFNEKTENTKNTKITADDTWSVGADRSLLVGKVLSVKVGASQTYTVGASRTVNTDANKMIGAASETVMIGGLRTFDIGGDLVTGCASLTRLVGAARVETAIEHSNRAVKGAQTVLVGGSWKTVAGASHNVAVSGASTEVVSGAKSIKASKYYLKVRGALNETLASRSVKAGGDRQEGFGAAASYAIAGATKIQGSDVTVSAKSNITINAGGVTITITPSSVTISGDVKSSVDCEDAGNTDYE